MEGSPTVWSADGRSLPPHPGRAACRFYRHIQVVSPTGTPVPVDPTSSEPYTSQEIETTILRPRAVCHWKPAAHREIPSGRGSDLLLAHLETRRGIRCADRVSSRPIFLSLRISH